MMSVICFSSGKNFVSLFFFSACLLVAGTVQAEVSPEEAKRRAALKHYEEKLKEQNEGTIQPASTNTPKSEGQPKVS